VVAGHAATKRQIFIYAIVLTVFSAVAPVWAGVASVAYGAVATALGAVFVWLSWQVLVMPESDAEMRPARRLFVFSNLYLFLLFAIMLAESGVPRIAA
jgi:protoheme IX farnesyltransferase